MSFDRVLWHRQFRRQRTLFHEGLSTLGQPGQQPTHRRGSSSATGIQLADPIAAESELLLEKLLVLLRDRTGQANGCRTFSDDLRGLRKRLEPFGGTARTRSPDPRWTIQELIAQSLPDQLAHSLITAAISKDLFKQRTT